MDEIKKELLKEYASSLRRMNQALAPYAVRYATSGSRDYKAADDFFRSQFQRDRDRILHSKYFRLLEHKTQVFVTTKTGHFRTRLTHSLEVAQIAKSIAGALRLNEALTEAIALAHDIGHSPFGHAGERALNELMKDDGGFEHNKQSLRVVEDLERRHSKHPGLNLTWEVREGLIKHSTAYDTPSAPPRFNPAEAPSLEAQCVESADEIAFTCHDLQDGLNSGILDPAEVKKLPIIQAVIEKKKIDASEPLENISYRLSSGLISMLLMASVKASYKRIRKENVRVPDDVRRCARLIALPPKAKKMVTELKDFLFQKMYHHPKQLKHGNMARIIIEKIFHSCEAHPEIMAAVPPASGVSKKRKVCDFIASLTDREAITLYQHLSQNHDLSTVQDLKRHMAVGQEELNL
jgi:dGTPase